MGEEERFLPRRPLVGSDNFGNLLRDPSLAGQEIVAAGLAERGYGDLRPTLLAVAQHLRAEGSRVTELAERSLLSKATVVGIVDELVELGYVTRAPDPSDGRAKLVVPTKRGLDAEQVGRELIAQLRDEWAELIGRREMERLEAGLRKLRAALWPDAAT
jgi:DNA-binding MarR family transcriptional regulator